MAKPPMMKPKQHVEPDADDKGGPSDGDADNKRAKRERLAKIVMGGC